jgi:hypothetical protein
MFPYLYLLTVYVLLFCISKISFHFYLKRKQSINKERSFTPNANHKKPYLLSFNNFFADLIQFP